MPRGKKFSAPRMFKFISGPGEHQDSPVLSRGLNTVHTDHESQVWRHPYHGQRYCVPCYGFSEEYMQAVEKEHGTGTDQG